MSSTAKTLEKETTAIQSGPIDIIKHRWIYLGVSLALVLPCVCFIILSLQQLGTPVRLGIDFTGGTMVEYGLEKALSQDDIPAIRTALEEMGYTGSVIQIKEPRQVPSLTGGVPSTAQNLQPEALKPETPQAVSGTSKAVRSIVSLRTKHMKDGDMTRLEETLKPQFGALQLLQKNSVGPTMAAELFQNGLLALLLAYLLIIGYLTFRFQFDYAICAIVALVHDTIFVIGAFAGLGLFFHTEVDSLFITAILTVVGFSVHDTIVVFDRLRENSRIFYTKKVPFNAIANMSVNQTLARSINTSLTALLTLIALYFFGGETTRDFVLAAILGIATGTYSSIFVASLCLAFWREFQDRSGSHKPATAALA